MLEIRTDLGGRPGWPEATPRRARGGSEASPARPGTSRSGTRPVPSTCGDAPGPLDTPNVVNPLEPTSTGVVCLPAPCHTGPAVETGADGVLGAVTGAADGTAVELELRQIAGSALTFAALGPGVRCAPTR